MYNRHRVKVSGSRHPGESRDPFLSVLYRTMDPGFRRDDEQQLTDGDLAMRRGIVAT